MSSSAPDGPENDGATTAGSAPGEVGPTPAPQHAADGPAPADAPADHASPADAAATDDGATEASTTGAPASEEPQDVTLLVDPDRVRRAPKYPVFLWVGALVGAVVGLIFSTWLIDVSGSAETLMKPGVYVSVTVLGGIALGLGVAGLVAVISDRRSLRRR
ncbi:hypothetical protein [Isoptericola sp. NPDC057653]|uniref:hypothetical protein n=1 Tax=unclassified Isoptericola TaxID=2623355 RepID=UPI0036CA35CE